MYCVNHKCVSEHDSDYVHTYKRFIGCRVTTFINKVPFTLSLSLSLSLPPHLKSVYTRINRHEVNKLTPGEFTSRTRDINIEN